MANAVDITTRGPEGSDEEDNSEAINRLFLPANGLSPLSTYLPLAATGGRRVAKRSVSTRSASSTS